MYILSESDFWLALYKRLQLLVAISVYYLSLSILRYLMIFSIDHAS